MQPLRTRANLPPWLQTLMQELLKPPPLLQDATREQTAAGKSRQPRRSQDSQGEARRVQPSGASADGSMPATRREWQAWFDQLGFPISLPHEYGWQIERAERIGDVLHIYTSQGEFALKAAHAPTQKLTFLAKLEHHLKRKGFDRFAAIVMTRRGQPFVQRGERTYYATRWIAGNHVNLASTTQLAQAAQSLALFHELSRGFSHGVRRSAPGHSVHQLLRRRADELNQLLADTEGRKQPDAFDDVLLRLAPSLREDAERSVSIAESPACVRFLEQDMDDPGICHLDVISGNMVVQPGPKVYLLDLDLAARAPRVLDMAHLVRRSLQLSGWRTEPAYTCFFQYNAVRPVTIEEYRLVLALLTFPHRAWRLARMRRTAWRDPAQIDDLKTFAAQEERRHEFLRAFAQQIDLFSPGGSA
ncbi:MAG: hypothetical protein IRZ33_06305 [Alicyclobacillaceae bacterium]|nr:hypothetical protein [Alicyclobacillaceae bacterium]